LSSVNNAIAQYIFCTDTVYLPKCENLAAINPLDMLKRCHNFYTSYHCIHLSHQILYVTLQYPTFPLYHSFTQIWSHYVSVRTFPPPGVCRLLSREPTRDFVDDMFGVRPLDGAAVTRGDVGLVLLPFAGNIPKAK